MNDEHYGSPRGAQPFFDIVMEGLRGEVDGETFWEVVAEDATFEFMYRFAGFATRIEGRDAYMKWFDGYSIDLHTSDNLRTYKADGGAIILEYEVHGTVPRNGKSYDNRFCSIVTIRDRKIIYWRDYMDSLAAMTALS